MKKIEIGSNGLKKIGMASLIALSLGLTGCGGTENEKPKNESTKEIENETDEVKFEEMTKEEMDVLVDGDRIEKLPDSEYLNEMGLDYFYSYKTWKKSSENDEYPEKSQSYYTTMYKKEWEDKVYDESGKKIIECQKFEFDSIVVGAVTFAKIESTGKWLKWIKTPNGSNLTQEITSQEKINELEKDGVQLKK